MKRYLTFFTISFVVLTLIFEFVMPLFGESYSLIEVITKAISLSFLLVIILLSSELTLNGLLKFPSLMFKFVIGYLYGVLGILNIFLQTPAKTNYYLFPFSIGFISLGFAAHVIHKIKKAEEAKFVTKTTHDTKDSNSEYLLYLKPDSGKSVTAIYFVVGWTILILALLGMKIDSFYHSLKQSYGELYALIALWSLALVFLFIWYLTKKVEVSVSNSLQVKLNFLRPRRCDCEFNLNEVNEVRVGFYGPGKYNNAIALEILNMLEIKKVKDLAKIKSLYLKASGFQKLELAQMIFVTQDLEEFAIYLDQENISYLKKLFSFIPDNVVLTARILSAV